MDSLKVHRNEYYYLQTYSRHIGTPTHDLRPSTHGFTNTGPFEHQPTMKSLDLEISSIQIETTQLPVGTKRTIHRNYSAITRLTLDATLPKTRCGGSVEFESEVVSSRNFEVHCNIENEVTTEFEMVRDHTEREREQFVWGEPESDGERGRKSETYLGGMAARCLWRP